MTTRILVADDQPVIRSGIVAMLASDPSLSVIGLADDGTETILKCRQLKPDLLILSFWLPRPSGIAVARVLSAEARAPRIVMCSSQVDAAAVHAALACGASGFMHTGISTHELIAGVHAATAGRQVLLGIDTVLQEDYSPLASQEVLILREVAHGLGNREIADLLGVSVRTVGAHMRSIFTKLDVHNRTNAVERARQQGYLAIE